MEVNKAMILLKSMICLTLGFILSLVYACRSLELESNRPQSDNGRSVSNSNVNPVGFDQTQAESNAEELHGKGSRCVNQMKPCEAYWMSRVVFVGKAEDIEPIVAGPGQNAANSSVNNEPHYIRIRFIVEKRYRGKLGADIQVRAPVNNSGVPEFKPGERYLVYASTLLKDYNSAFVEECGRTKLVANSAEDLAYIEGLPVPDSDIIEAEGGLRAISTPKLLYPREAKKAGITGPVFVRLIVDESGKVKTAQAVCGHKALNKAAERAVRHWRFAPTLVSGRPIKVSTVFGFNFRD